MNIVFSSLEKNANKTGFDYIKAMYYCLLHTLHQSGELGSILKVLQRMRLIMIQMNATLFTRHLKNNK